MYFLFERLLTEKDIRLLAQSHDFDAINEIHCGFQTIGNYDTVILNDTLHEPFILSEEEGDAVPAETLDPSIVAHQQWLAQDRYCRAEAQFLIETLSCQYDNINDVLYLLNESLAGREG